MITLKSSKIFGLKVEPRNEKCWFVLELNFLS